MLRAHLVDRRTGVFLGPSGVGKSSLANCLLGDEVLVTGAVRESDQKGRHTTTRRELFTLPGGGILIDTPGMREFQLFEGNTGGFDDIEKIAARCRFGDCAHQGEPGCAVAESLGDGTLDRGRWESYAKLQRELRWIASRRDEHSRREEKQRVRKTHRMYREIINEKRRRQGR